MKTFLVFLTVFLQLNHANSIDSPSMSFIVNGQNAEPGEFPHYLSLEMKREGKWNNHCGAVLINKLQAITATFCIDGYSQSDLRIVGGIDDESDMAHIQTVTLKKIVRHPDYKDEAAFMANDLSILTFSEALELNDRVQPIVWNQDDSVTFAGDQCVISGWGRTTKAKSRDPKFSPDVLQKVTMEVLSNEKCKEKMNIHSLKVYPGHVCVFKPNYGAATGDSGSPLTCQHNGKPILAGVVSWYTRGDPVDPSVFARVSHFKQFILDNIVEE